jgi:ATP synthase protein I
MSSGPSAPGDDPDGSRGASPSGQGSPGSSTPSEADLAARLKRLDQRLDTVRQRRTEETGHAGLPKSDDPSALARALRLSTEFVAAVLVGGGIGYLADRWLGTLPWGLIVFLLLGFVAGILNVMRAAGLATGEAGKRKP